jgi:hypothetical protein
MNKRATNIAVGLLLLGLPVLAARGQGDARPGASSTNAAATNVAAAVTNIPAFLEVVDSGVYLHIDDEGLTFDVGKQVFLFQQNSDSFICLVPYQDGESRLCAFPRMSGRDQGTGWVTNEKFLFFGVRSRSIEGRFFFTRGERLPVIYETNGYRRVAIERFGRIAEVDLPDDFPGMEYIPAPAPVQVAAPPPKTTPAKPAVEAPKLPKDELPEAVPSKPELTAAAPVEEPAFSNPEDVPLTPITGSELTPLSEEPERTFKEKMSALISQNLWLLELLLALAILAAIPIIIKRNKASLLARSSRAQPPPAPNFGLPAMAAPSPPPPMNIPLDEDEAVTAVESQITKKSADEFSGSLETFTMGDLIQFIHSTTKTGALEIQAETAAGQHCLIFELGEIIDAVAVDKRGEEAVYAICRIKKGTYTFSREARSGVNKTVDKSTMSLLLDAHRIMDEEGDKAAEPAPETAKPPEPPPPKAEEKPKKKRQKLTMK